MDKFNVILKSDNDKSKLLSCRDYVVEKKYYYDKCEVLDLNYEPEIFVYGNKYNQKRNVGFYSDDSVGYKYSGQIAKSKCLYENAWLWMLMNDVNKELGTNFNGVLVNGYSSGEKYISPHSDDERSLDKEKKYVVSIAFGAKRVFRIRDKFTKKIVHDHIHHAGELLIMSGDFQKHYTHEIIKDSSIKEPRFSLTFRHHLE